MTDNRRLTLWVAFALVLLGGIGLDQLARGAAREAWPGLGSGPGRSLGWPPGWGWWLWRSASAASSRGSAPGPWNTTPRPPRTTPGADPREYRARAERQVRQTLTFVPRYLCLAGGHLLGLVALAALWRRGRVGAGLVRPVLLGSDALRPVRLRRRPEPGDRRRGRPPRGPGDRVPPPRGRARWPGPRCRRGAAAEHPDALRPGRRPQLRLGRAGAEPGLVRAACTRPIPRPVRAGARSPGTECSAAASGSAKPAVRAVVAATPPPPGAFARVERVGPSGSPASTVCRWPRPAAQRRPSGGRSRDPGLIRIRFDGAVDDRIVVRETFDPGWRAEVDGAAVPVEPHRGAFLAVPVPAGQHELVLRYDPPEVPLALAISISALAAAVFALTGFRPFRSTRIIAVGLGRTQAVELESDRDPHRIFTRPITEG